MPDNNYWKKRMEHIEDMNRSKGIAYTQHIDKQFRIAQKNIEQKIDYWYARLADNNEISLSAARKLLAADELEDFHLTVEEYIKKGEALDYDPRWAKQLENASAKVHISRLEALKMQMQQECEVLFGGMADGLDDTLTDIYTSGYYHTAYEYMKGNGVGWAFNRLDNRRIKKALETCWTNDGSTFTARCWKNKQKLVNELNTILTQNIIRGESQQKAIQLLSKRMKVSRFNAGRLIMTESAFFNAQSQHDCYKDLDVEKFEFVATLDSSTSEICRDMDGKVFKMSEYEVGVNAPPLHCFCRSCTVPYFDDDTDSVRAARNAEGKIYNVPANMTYREWEKSFVDGDKTGLKEIKSDDIIKEKEPSEAMQFIKKQCEGNNVEYREVEKLQKALPSDEIIERLAGGDMTNGSCSSLALAYIGNRNGLDVLDFRGGESQYVFSLKSNIKKMLELPGVNGSIAMVKKEIAGTMELLNNLELNKEYYLATGKHAAIVRRIESGFEYLELQSKYQNGWTPFDRYGSMAKTLSKRFGCRKTVDKSFGKVWEKSVVLMDVESFDKNTEFEQILGYINTALERQKKGAAGDVK